MRRVRLTEGQLHNVIRESVSQILNELDWKTYDSAARKRQEQNYSDDFYSSPLWRASIAARHKKYPHLKSAIDHLGECEPVTPEEDDDYYAFCHEFNKYMNGDYKYEKGGRGYYLDDEDE